MGVLFWYTLTALLQALLQDTDRITPTPTLLLSLAGAAGDKGLSRLCPGHDRAAGGIIHHVHPSRGTSNIYKEETEEGKRFNHCLNAHSCIWEDLYPCRRWTGTSGRQQQPLFVAAISRVENCGCYIDQKVLLGGSTVVWKNKMKLLKRPL